MLTASALVSSYCKSANCEEDSDIQSMVKGVIASLSGESDDTKVNNRKLGVNLQYNH